MEGARLEHSKGEGVHAVEGYTEESFVNNVLAPHLASYSVSANCLPLNGISTYAKIEAFVCRMLKSDKSAFLTTIIDLYGLPNKFPGYRDAKECNSGGEKAGLIAERWLEHPNRQEGKRQGPDQSTGCE